MTWDAKYKRPLVALASIGLVAMLFLVASRQVLAGNYNRNAAVAYADQWAHGRNPAYREYALDCTNYASQVLRAGGYPMRGSGQLWEDTIRHWWFVTWPVKRNSTTWSNTNWMNMYFSQYQGSEFVFKGWPTELGKGDILLMGLPGGLPDPDHASVIVGYGYASDESEHPGQWGLLRDAHTEDRKRVLWDDYVPSGTGYWPWRVVW